MPESNHAKFDRIADAAARAVLAGKNPPELGTNATTLERWVQDLGRREGEHLAASCIGAKGSKCR